MVTLNLYAFPPLLPALATSSATLVLLAPSFLLPGVSVGLPNCSWTLLPRPTSARLADSIDSGSSVRFAVTTGDLTAASSGSVAPFKLARLFTEPVSGTWLGRDLVEVGEEGASPRWPSVNVMEGERGAVLLRGGEEG